MPVRNFLKNSSQITLAVELQSKIDIKYVGTHLVSIHLTDCSQHK